MKAAIEDENTKTHKPPANGGERNLAEMLEGRTGLFHSGRTDLSINHKEVFGEMLVEKFRKQGLDT